MQNPDLQLFVISAADVVTGIRMDRILSFTHQQGTGSLTIRYIGESNPERFEGPVAEAILRELRYAGRK